MKSCGSGPCHDSKWLDSSAHHVLTQYIRIMKLHRSILEQRLNKTGVYRSQHQILTTLAEHSNASQKEIAEYLNVTAATIAVSVKKLEKGGYITRIVDQEDNRYNKLCLTEEGLDVVEHSRQFFKNVENQMFLGFTEEEFQAMEGYLERIYANLADIPTNTTTKQEDS